MNRLRTLIIVFAILVTAADTSLSIPYSVTTIAQKSKISGTVDLIKIATDPTIIKAGNIVKITYKLELYDLEKYNNISVLLKPEYPFSVKPGTPSINIYGKVPENAVIYDEFYIFVDPDTLGGNYPLKLLVCLEDCKQSYKEVIFNIKVEGGPEFYLKDVQIEPLAVAGETANIRLVIENQGTGSAKDVVVTVSTVAEGGRPGTFAIIGHGNTFRLGDMAPKTSKKLEFPLKISEYAKGSYTLPISVNYRDSPSPVSLKMGIDVKNHPVLVISSVSPSFIEAGRENTVVITIINSGTGTAKNTKFVLSTIPISNEANLFSVVNSGTERYIGNLKTMETKSVNYTIYVSPDASGTYSFPVYIFYENSPQPTTMKINLNVLKRRAVLHVASVNMPDFLQPGIKEKIDFDLCNTGEEPATDIKINISPVSSIYLKNNGEASDTSARDTRPLVTTDLYSAMLSHYFKKIQFPASSKGVVPLGSSAFFIKKLSPNECKTVNFQVMASSDTPEGSYQIKVGIKYDNTVGTEFKQESNIGLAVKGVARVSIGNLRTDPEKVRAGDNDVLLKAEIVNTGTGKAKNLEITVISPSLEFKSGKRYVVGNLERDGSKEAIFIFDIPEEVKPGDVPLSFILNYEQPDGTKTENRFSEVIKVTKKPVLVIEDIETENFYPGGLFRVKLFIKNIGSSEAESVSVKGVLQGDLPYEYDKKTDYIGNIDSGEMGVAVLEGSIKKDAIPKQYKMSFELRCVGDRDTGDTNVYIFERTVSVGINNSYKTQGSKLGYRGIIVTLLLAAFLLVYIFRRG